MTAPASSAVSACACCGRRAGPSPAAFVCQTAGDLSAVRSCSHLFQTVPCGFTSAAALHCALRGGVRPCRRKAAVHAGCSETEGWRLRRQRQHKCLLSDPVTSVQCVPSAQFKHPLMFDHVGQQTVAPRSTTSVQRISDLKTNTIPMCSAQFDSRNCLKWPFTNLRPKQL